MYVKDPPTQILYCYGIYQPLFDEMEQNVPNFMSKQGLPSSEEIDEFTADRCHKLIVIDDLMHKVKQDKEMELLFTQETQCHSDYPKFIPRRKTRQDHCFKYVVHSIDEKFERCFTSGYTGSSAISRFMKAYGDAVGSKEGYLIVDTSPHGDDRYRLRIRVFPGQDPLVYRLS